MDRLSPEKRSWNMSKIRCKDTTPEILFRKLLYAKGIRFRLHRKNLPGSPDLVLTKYNAVIFIHGCFWHLHGGCSNARIPSTRHEFWKKKLEGNRNRDKRDREELLALGWRVLTVWECSLHARSRDLFEFADSIVDWLRSDAKCAETTVEGCLVNVDFPKGTI